MIDPYFSVKTLGFTYHPENLAYLAMHQDYSESFVADKEALSRSDAGHRVVRHLLLGNRGHFGPLEHSSITFAVGYFPHSVIQQARTHRIGTSWDVQSMRYTGKRICDVASGKLDPEEVFYLRPVGGYTNRQGKKYFYSERQRARHLQMCEDASEHYAEAIKEGMSEEHARGVLPFDYRQHFVVTFNMRSLMHFLDLRAKADAQIEIRTMCEMMLPFFHTWAPSVAEWYATNRWQKARLAP